MLIKRSLRFFAITLVFSAAGACISTVLSGCNTTRGAGQDVKELGQSVQDSAERHGAEH